MFPILVKQKDPLKLEQMSIKNQDVDKNEIADHCWKNDHEMNWEERKVIDVEPYIYARKIKETIYSIKDKNHINNITTFLKFGFQI